MDDNTPQHIIAVFRFDVESVLGDEIIEVEGLREVESGINFNFLEDIQIKDDSLQINNHDLWKFA